ncbi:unnamed protein product [Onchocerca flexuosa]|uniref:INCENP_ARK-bind domain-containing protein n=1 Tax=Onchocerca flexuosa TaxID=387005 RepID=A0A183HYC5_9BILA|nr:unnamed protein product [Onchocerca flexuosa]
MFAAWSLITEKIAITADDSDYDYLNNDLDENQKPADIFWGDVLDDEQQKEINDSFGGNDVQRRNCSTETAIIDKLLNVSRKNLKLEGKINSNYCSSTRTKSIGVKNREKGKDEKNTLGAVDSEFIVLVYLKSPIQVAI